MSLYVNGSSFSTSRELKVGATSVNKVVCDGVTVWQKSSSRQKSSSGPQWFTCYSGALVFDDIGSATQEVISEPYYRFRLNTQISLSDVPSSPTKFRIYYAVSSYGNGNGAVQMKELTLSSNQQRVAGSALTSQQHPIYLSAMYNGGNTVYVSAEILGINIWGGLVGEWFTITQVEVYGV